MIAPFLNQSLPLDIIKDAPPAFALAPRRLKSGYKGAPIRVRDDTITESDIPFCGQDLCTRTLLSWLSRNQVASIPLGTDGNADGVSDGWSKASDAGITATHSIDDSAQKIEVTASTSTSNTYITYTLSCIAGNSITLNIGNYKVSGNVRARLWIDWYTSTPSYISSSTVTLGTSTTYEPLINSSIVAPATATQARIRIGLNPLAIGNTGAGWFKNNSVTISNQSAYVVTAYDQSGNANHATQTTAANQPRIVNAGVLDVDASGKPTMVFDGTNDVLTIANSASVDILGAPLMLNAVFNNNNGAGYIISKNLDTAATNQYALSYNTTNKAVELYLEGSIRQSTASESAPINTQKIVSEEFTTGVQKGYVNGVSSGTDGNTNTALTSRANMQIGARSNNAGGTAWAIFFKGNISEIIILTSTSGRSKLERNQGKFYQLGVA